jgi:hypothetical protein
MDECGLYKGPRMQVQTGFSISLECVLSFLISPEPSARDEPERRLLSNADL